MPLDKSVLLPFGLPAAMSATDAGIQKIIVSNEEMEHIMKIVKSLEESG